MPTKRKYLSLVIPVYNESARISRTLERCAKFFRSNDLAAEIIVADDGSTDETRKKVLQAIAKNNSVNVTIRYISLPHHGKGSAVRHGVLSSTGDPIIFLDADLTIPVELVKSFLAEIKKGADIAVASRYIPGSQISMPRRRMIMGRVFRGIVALATPSGIKDTQCGGKAYRRNVAMKLFSKQKLSGFSFDAEILYLAKKNKLKVVEVPFVLKQKRESSINIFRDGPVMLGDILRIRLLNLLGKYR